MDFPGAAELVTIRRWCSTHRGSVRTIAELVVQRDGTRGINHSAVSRTLAGRERNSLVIDAYRRLRASKQPLVAKRSKSAAATR